MSEHLPARSRIVHDSLRAAGISGDIVVLPDAAATAPLAAAALGVEVGAIANSLVFWSDDEPLLVMTSGAHRVDTAALAERLGREKIQRATAEQVREATGQAIGGVAPTGHPAPLPTIVDEDLAAYRGDLGGGRHAAHGLPAHVRRARAPDRRHGLEGRLTHARAAARARLGAGDGRRRRPGLRAARRRVGRRRPGLGRPDPPSAARACGTPNPSAAASSPSTTSAASACSPARDIPCTAIAVSCVQTLPPW